MTDRDEPESDGHNYSALRYAENYANRSQGKEEKELQSIPRRDGGMRQKPGKDEREDSR